jgi:predicted Zn-dependent protease with MMP-like domain
MLKKIISKTQSFFLYKDAYSAYQVKEFQPFLNCIKNITKHNIEQQTQEAERLFLTANWDVKTELLLSDTSDIPFLENCKDLYPKSFIIKLLLGELYIIKAWDIRGDDYVDTVNKEKWVGFENYLEKAIETLNACLEIKPDLAITYQCLMTAFVGLGGTDTVYELFKQAQQYEPENIYLYRDMMWAISPRWNCHAEASIDDMYQFMQDALDTIPSLNKYHLWLHYLQECETEMESEDYENYINDEKVREFTNIIINDFEHDKTLSSFNIHHANRILLTAYELSIENEKLLNIVDNVLPNNISLYIWQDYADTPKEAYKLIKELIKLNKK